MRMSEPWGRSVQVSMYIVVISLVGVRASFVRGAGDRADSGELWWKAGSGRIVRYCGARRVCHSQNAEVAMSVPVR